jgi:hypothetical protein
MYKLIYRYTFAEIMSLDDILFISIREKYTKKVLLYI